MILVFFLRGNANIGGGGTVTLVPRSPEVSAPTFRLPFAATILLGFNTVGTPVSSTFHICEAANYGCQLFKKDVHIFSLKRRFSTKVVGFRLPDG